jgi:hypothetical protein
MTPVVTPGPASRAVVPVSLVEDCYPYASSSYLAANTAAVLAWLDDAEAALAAAAAAEGAQGAYPELAHTAEVERGVEGAGYQKYGRSGTLDYTHPGTAAAIQDSGPFSSTILKYYFKQKLNGKQNQDQGLTGGGVGTKVTLSLSFLPKGVPRWLKHLPVLGQQLVMRTSMKTAARQMKDALAVEDKVSKL